MATYSLAEVAKHTTKDDCWVVVSGQVLDVTKFLPDHPGGELAILTFAGKDATAEFDMIHPPDVVPKYAPDAIIGTLGESAPAAAAPAAAAPAAVEAAPVAAAPSDGGYTMAEVQKHTTKDDCWVVLNGQVLDVTKFLPDHPGGELAILTFAGKDATAEFDMIHPPDVVHKYAPDAIIGELSKGAPAPVAAAPVAAAPVAAAPAAVAAPAAAAPAPPGGLKAPLLQGDDAPSFGMLGTCFYLVRAFMLQLFGTIFFTGNFKVTGDRKGLTRSAMFLIMFMVIHAIGNLHVFLGPDDFNGYGYFYVRLYWTGFGLPANIVEEYVLLCALLHVAVGLRRTWDISLNYSINSGKLNLAFSGLWLFAFMTIHLFQFRFGATQSYLVRPPPYLINVSELLKLRLFWTSDESVAPVAVRDIYKLEYDVFTDGWTTLFYIASVFVFVAHFILGWQKVVPSSAFNIPKYHHGKVNLVGTCIALFIGLCYLSFPIYCRLTDPSPGAMGHI